MGLIEWAAGLILFNVLLILLIVQAGASGLDVGDFDSSIVDDLSINSSSTVRQTDIGIFTKFGVGFTNLPSWFKLFFVTFQAALVILLILAYLRGVN